MQSSDVQLLFAGGLRALVPVFATVTGFALVGGMSDAIGAFAPTLVVVCAALFGAVVDLATGAIAATCGAFELTGAFVETGAFVVTGVVLAATGVLVATCGGFVPTADLVVATC